MSRHFIKEDNEIIFKEYKRLGMERDIKVAINVLHKLAFIKKRHLIRRIIKIVSCYNKGMQDLLVEGKRGINRRPGSGAPGKKWTLLKLISYF
ncbi:transposase [Mycoplasma phocimorsus]|uniref:transposase n=1 Tax=Mycoplasma phocimorsus TaxID=3045839 RepID=UPI0024BF2C39|nr:transposase [Mycoplasma phocimorsus]MDJ1647016.1 transposase [Mycoplasma phocimorsus]